MTSTRRHDEIAVGSDGGGRFAQALRSHRLAARLTQEQLAESAGLSARTIRDLERGRVRHPQSASVRLLAAALSLSEPNADAFERLADVAYWQQRKNAARQAAPGDGCAALPAATAVGEPVAWPPTNAVAGWTPSPASPAPAVVQVCQLPADAADFAGRSAECARLVWLLTSGGEARPAAPVVAISGPPGVGKTALAVHVAHQVRPAFPDGQLFVALAGASARPRQPSDLLEDLLRVLGVRPTAMPESLDARAALFRSWLADRRVLVVLDDAALPGQVRPLLPGTAGCAVLVTSRSRLAGLEGAVPAVLDCLSSEQAVTMLARVAGEQRMAVEPEAAGKVVAACGRLPLAVRIAGAKLAARPSWPVGRVAELLVDQRRRLDELVVDDLGVRASIAVSYQALGSRARRAFRRLAMVGPRDFAEWVVAALLGQPDASGPLGVLADNSLVSPAGTDTTDEPRYRLHDLLRDYAAERVADEPPDQQRAALERVLTGYLELADLADRGTPSEPSFPPVTRLTRRVVVPDRTARRLTADPVAWFTAERLALVAVTEQACAVGRPRLAAALAGYQMALQDSQARSEDTVRVWEAVLAAAELAGDPGTAADARLRLAVTTIWLGRSAQASLMLDECNAVLQASGDDRNLAYCLAWRSYAANTLDRNAQARRDAEHGLQHARQADDPAAESFNLRLLGFALAQVGHSEAGLAHCRDAVDLARRLANPLGEYLALHSLASTHLAAGQPRQTITVGRQALDRATENSYQWGQARSLDVLGQAYHALGRHGEAVGVLSQALPVLEQFYSRRIWAQCLLSLGRAHHALGQHRLAIEFLDQSLPVFAELRLPAWERRSRHLLARCRQAVAEPS